MFVAVCFGAIPVSGSKNDNGFPVFLYLSGDFIEIGFAEVFSGAKLRTPLKKILWMLILTFAFTSSR